LQTSQIGVQDHCDVTHNPLADSPTRWTGCNVNNNL